MRREERNSSASSFSVKEMTLQSQDRTTRSERKMEIKKKKVKKEQPYRLTKEGKESRARSFFVLQLLECTEKSKGNSNNRNLHSHTLQEKLSLFVYRYI